MVFEVMENSPGRPKDPTVSQTPTHLKKKKSSVSNGERNEELLYLIVNGDPTCLTRIFPGESELRHGSSFFSSSNRSADSILQYDGGSSYQPNKFKKLTVGVCIVTFTEVLKI